MLKKEEEKEKKMKVPEGSTQVGMLDHLLGQVSAYLEEGGELLSEEEVLMEVRELCEDEGVPLAARVEVLTVAEKHLSLSEDDLQLVRVMRTGGVVAEAWGEGEEEEGVRGIGAVGPDQLSTSEARAALLTSLIAATSTLTQAKALIHLLHLWPPFDPQMYGSVTSNPWLLVLGKLLEVTEGSVMASGGGGGGLQVVWEAARHAHSLNQFPLECLVWLVGRLRGLGRGAVRGCCKVALLSDDAKVLGAVVEAVEGLQEVTEEDYDSDLLREVVERGLVARILSTLLYGPLVTFLMECGDPGLVRQAVGQLSEAGRQREASSLACLSTTLPKTLLTAASALKTYRKWL